MELTKLEMTALENIATDIRRSANKLTNVPWYTTEDKDNTREYQQSNVRNVIYDVEEIVKALKQIEQILNTGGTND